MGNGTDLQPRPADRTLHIIEQRGLDVHLLIEIVRGMKMDLVPRRYETLDDLLKYCWRAACAVGLVSIDIFGCKNPASTVYAENSATRSTHQHPSRCA